MSVAEVRPSGEGRSLDGGATSARRKYVVPSLSRYGTLADLTGHSGSKNLNDGSGGGCGMNNFETSCVNPS
jgi:hypothetical protein